MKLLVIFLGICSLMSCNPNVSSDPNDYIKKTYGHWIKETNGEVMLDPQPSGLAYWRGKLLTVSDRSAHESQRLRLRAIDSRTAELSGPDMQITLSAQAKLSCFADYVSGNPDLEALTVDPDDDSVFYLVTEDASDAEPLTEQCHEKYHETGSTDYPSLLLRLAIQADQKLSITHIKPIQFNPDMQVGNFPNDGFEGLTFGQNRTLYLAMEKDQQKQARVFSLVLDKEFWATDDYAKVTDVGLKLPKFKNGNHPINGMDYYQTAAGKEFLILAARNDQKLWVADLSGQKDTKIVPLEFYAEIIGGHGVCKDYEETDNISIEGVAVIDETLWMVNDPWKAVYLNNIRCPQNKRNYQKFAPLLFSLPIQASWFE
ncbi:esterase-like activity of phytase family protein [Paraglaciecola aquimarina]|uniref:Esterase-like activity of phytase family protein n=1 Tax=Paraglaciecola algarum TaxID=3050085 RepID=A0ABS9D3I0_9ALTE|nr:esterase-like activity of phytase family protein [Paraglaciecola sp. G1-23]MCF2947305.1 esterase-like activity of phytase family protein [Paraglaciecola sp. G1-23]